MAPVESLNPDDDLWHAIASELRFERERRGLSLTDVGNLIDAPRQAVSNMEHARPDHRLQPRQAEKLDAAWDLNGRLVRLVKWAKAQAKQDKNVEWFKEYAQYEQEADELRWYESQIVPGLLQTPDYARAVLTEGYAGKDVESTLKKRLDRQKVLSRPTPPLLWVLLDESVLDRPVGGPEVMGAQLAHLLELTEQPHILIRVIPRAVGFHRGLEGSVILVRTEREEAAYTEAWGGGTLTVDRAEIRKYGILYDRVGVKALPVDSTRDLIKRVMEGFRGLA